MLIFYGILPALHFHLQCYRLRCFSFARKIEIDIFRRECSFQAFHAKSMKISSAQARIIFHYPDFSFSSLFFVLRFSLLFCAFLLSFPRISRVLQRGKSSLFSGDPRFFAKKARIGGLG